MGSALSNNFENQLIDHLFKGSALSQPTNIYVALSTADPGPTGSTIAEPTTSGTAYARVAFNTWNAAVLASNVGKTTNNGNIVFAEATAGWGTITHVALFVGATSGAATFFGAVQLDASKTIATGDVFQVDSGSLAFTIGGGSILANGFKTKVLDHLFKGSALSQPTAITIGLSTADPGVAGGSLAEPSGGSYARISANSWNASATNGSGQGETSNNGDLTFATASAGWGTITHVPIFFDSVFFGAIALDASKVISSSDVFQARTTTLKYRIAG